MDNKQALRFEKFGNPDVFELQEVPVTEPGEGEVLGKVAAASVNPSDVKNVAGALKATLPRTPGRDFAGIVVSPGEWTGLEVWGAGYEFGVKRDGSHAEYLHVPVAGLAPKPNNLSMSQAAACGVPFLAAWMGLVDTAQLRSGQRVLITGVHGAVGQAAVQIARWRGCEVIGADQSGPVNDSPYVRTSDSNWPDRVREWSKGGVDVVLDAVGGVLFESCLHCLRQGGQQIAIASTGDPHVSFHLPDFFHELLHLSGADTFKLASQDIARIMGRTEDRFRKGGTCAAAYSGAFIERRAEGVRSSQPRHVGRTASHRFQLKEIRIRHADQSRCVRTSIFKRISQYGNSTGSPVGR